MKTRKHLSLEERERLTILQNSGMSIRKIAQELGRNASTISRELRRENAVYYRGQYLGASTYGNVKRYWKECHKRINIHLAPKEIRKFIRERLKYGYSPQIISIELKQIYNVKISHETIYKYIYTDAVELKQYLLRRKLGRKPRKRKLYKPNNPNIPNRTDISLRSIEANNRLELGHFEADSVESCRKRGGSHSCLTVLVERASRKTIIKKTASLTSIQTTTSILKAMKPYKNTIKSITYDNGSEFTRHEKINKMLNIKSYFCKPYHSWEKGTVENINGLIRRFFPKGTNFDTITLKQIKYVEDWINNRPMKVLGYLTPNQKFQQLSVAIAS